MNMLDRTSNLPRQLLATAIADRNAVALNHRNAVVAADHARSMMTSAQAHLLSFVDLQSRITAFRADKIAEWSAGPAGGSRPSMDLPKELEEALSERDLAQADAASAKAVYERLAADVEAATVTLQRAEDLVKAKADDILIESAEAVAEELEREQAFVDALRFRLRAFLRIMRPMPGAAERAATGLTVPTFAPLIGAPRLRELAEYPREPFSSAHINPEGPELANWQAYHRRLLTDPYSVLDQSS
jgi:hypothetical protein